MDLIRSNPGVELSLSNNDHAGPAYEDNVRAGVYRETAQQSVAVAQRVREIGEIRYNRQQFGRAIEWIRAHPNRFASLTSSRAMFFWFDWWRTPVTACVLTATTLLACIGGWMLWRDGHRWLLQLFVMVWLCYPVTYYLVQYLPRYRISIWWTVLLTAAYGVGRVARQLGGWTDISIR